MSLKKTDVDQSIESTCMPTSRASWEIGGVGAAAGVLIMQTPVSRLADTYGHRSPKGECAVCCCIACMRMQLVAGLQEGLNGSCSMSLPRASERWPLDGGCRQQMYLYDGEGAEDVERVYADPDEPKVGLRSYGCNAKAVHVDRSVLSLHMLFSGMESGAEGRHVTAFVLSAASPSYQPVIRHHRGPAPLLRRNSHQVPQPQNRSSHLHQEGQQQEGRLACAGGQAQYLVRQLRAIKSAEGKQGGSVRIPTGLSPSRRRFIGKPPMLCSDKRSLKLRAL